VATAAESIVQYARWIESGQSRDWKTSGILKGIRDYNADDCKSTAELLQWLKILADKNKILSASSFSVSAPTQPRLLPPEVTERLNTAAALRQQGDPISVVLADLVDFHRREQKPIWWRMFDLASATSEQLRDDLGCIEGIQRTGVPLAEKNR